MLGIRTGVSGDLNIETAPPVDTLLTPKEAANLSAIGDDVAPPLEDFVFDVLQGERRDGYLKHRVSYLSSPWAQTRAGRHRLDRGRRRCGRLA